MRDAAISTTSDGQLVAEVQSGDLAAFGHLVRRHAPTAKRMAVLWGAGADADDVVQDAFVKAYAALPRFRADGEFRAWLLTIVRNETRNVFRSRGRRAAREELARLDPESFTLDPEAQALTAVRRDELLDQVRGAAGRAARGGGLPLPAGADRGRDGDGPAAAGRHREVAAAPRVERLAEGGDRCLRRPISSSPSSSALGRGMVVEPPAEDLVERVLARIPAEPRRTRTRWSVRARRRRLVAVIIALVIIGLGLTPPVRAAVVEWLRIGGVLIKTGPPASGPRSPAEPPPTQGAALTLEQARALVAFPIGVPAELGAPDRIEVSPDRRVVSMDWTSGSDSDPPRPVRRLAELDLRQEVPRPIRGHRRSADGTRSGSQPPTR